jgi:hypothetical protein
VGYAAAAALAGASRLHWTIERALQEGRSARPDTMSWCDTEDVLRRWGAITRMFLALGA